MVEREERSSLVSRLRPWFPALLWLLLIFTLSSLSLQVNRIRIMRYQDKVAHFFEYGVLGLLLARGAYLSRPNRKIIYWLCIAGAALYGVSDEIHQMWVPHRTPEVLDALTDLAGAFVFTWSYLRWKGQRLFGFGSDNRGGVSGID